MVPNKVFTKNIKGWGADLDHKNRPAYPRERMSGDVAYKLSENDIRHWLLLLFAEMGLGAALKHNRAAFIKKTAVAVGLLGLGVVLLQRRRRANMAKSLERNWNTHSRR